MIDKDFKTEAMFAFAAVLNLMEETEANIALDLHRVDGKAVLVINTDPYKPGRMYLASEGNLQQMDSLYARIAEIRHAGNGDSNGM